MSACLLKAGPQLQAELCWGCSKAGCLQLGFRGYSAPNSRCCAFSMHQNQKEILFGE